MAVGFRGAVLEGGGKGVRASEEVGAIEESFGALIMEGWRVCGSEELGGECGAGRGWEEEESVEYWEYSFGRGTVMVDFCWLAPFHTPGIVVY